MPSLFGYLLLATVLMIALSRSTARQQISKLTEADRAALEATGDLAAAEGALGKLEVDSTSAAVRANNSGYSSLNTGSAERMQAAHLLLRKVAMHKAAQAFGLAPGTEAGRNATE